MKAVAAVGVAGLLAACTQIHTQLVELTGDEARATCIEVAGMDAIQRSSPLGIDLFLQLARAGLSCYLLPVATPGVPSEVVALPAEAPAPPQALEIVPPPEALAVIQDEL